MKTIRGAISIENDCEKEIDDAIEELFNIFLKQDECFFENIDAIIFSITDDIRSKNPAKSLRENFSGVADISLMVFKEADFDSSAEKIIRTLIFYENMNVKPVYARRARFLRPDIISG